MDDTTRTNMTIFFVATLVLIGVSAILNGWIESSWPRIALGAVVLVAAGVVVQVARRREP